jgi:hypothetical protein
MIYRDNVENACFELTRRNGGHIHVTPQLVDLITSILNGLITDAEPRGERAGRELGVLRSLERNVLVVLEDVLKIKGVPPQFDVGQSIVLIDVIDFLRWLIPAQRRSQLGEIIEGLPWMFDCK